MIPNRIYVSPIGALFVGAPLQREGDGTTPYLRADKVMEILKSRRDNITLGRPMYALPEDQQTEVYCINAILKEIEAL